MQRIIKTSHSSSLANVVCAWQPSKLAHLAKHFSDSCAAPEASFSGYDRYKAYFEPLLFAEITAELQSAIDKYQRAATLRNPKVRAKREETSTTVASVLVQRVTKVHSLGFGWTIEVDSNDRRGPVGCVDNDVVMLWLPEQNTRNAPTPRKISSNAVLAVVVRPINRTGCRLIMTQFPDGNERGVRTDLEDGEEDEQQPPSLRVWSLLRVGSLTTMKREFDALQQIKTSPLLPSLLRPNIQALRTVEDAKSVHKPHESTKDRKLAPDTPDAQPPKYRNELVFTNVVSKKTGLNTSQTRAIMHACTCQTGFSVIQGPPGTGKTRTLIALLNVIHMTQYHEYYEDLLASLDPIPEREDPSEVINVDKKLSIPEKGAEASLLHSMMVSMNKTVATASDAKQSGRVVRRARRPRLLICAPSNSAVDEVLTRLTRTKFVDGQGREYCPELARIGNGDRVSEAAKPFTAEGQAETFLDRVCAEDMTPEAQKNAQMSFLKTWQNRCNALLLQLERTPKKQSASRPAILDLHEKLERMDRDLRRLSIAASDGATCLTRDEKLRQIARTYVEDAQLVFATLSGSASSILTKKGQNDLADLEGPLFDTVVIDEGAQATETSCLIPMTLGAKRCLLVGDPQQLPATVLSSGAAGLAYGQSLLERVCRAGQSVQLLDTQYRMHPAISSFPRRYFYNGRLVDDESVQGDNRARPYHRDAVRPKLGPYVFLDISEGEERRSRDDRSIFNPAEAELAALIYTKLKKEYAKDSLFTPAAKVQGSVAGFGVVTPYKRQMQELRQSFDRAGIPTGDVEIDTVDSFQGREKDVIVFSCVRTASVNNGIGFVRDVRRMNVGLTRARASLIILGSAQALSEGSKDWAELIEDANSRGCLISVSNVARCLEPPRVMETVTAPEKSKLQSVSGEKVTSARVENSFMTEKTRNVTAPPRSADPRLRSARREVPTTEPVHAQEQQMADEETGEIRSTLSHAAVVEKPLSSGNVDSSGADPATSSQAHGAILPEHDQMKRNGVSNTESSDVPRSVLQSTLQQMSILLSEAGFHNTEALESSLREHVRSGGALDVETVMAAAIAANSTNTKDTQQHNKDATPGGSDPRKAEQIKVEQSTTNRKTAAAEKSTSRDDKPDEPIRTGTAKPEAVLRQATPVHKSLPKEESETKEPKPDSKGQRTGQLAKAEGSQVPSGWDMLFAGSNGPKTETAPDKSARDGSGTGSTQRAPSDRPSERKSGSEKNQESQSEEEMQTSVTGNGQDEVKPHPTSSTSLTHFEVDRGMKRPGTREYGSGGKEKFKRPKNEKNREFDRKRGRPPEFNRGSGRGARQLEIGRGRPKRLRGGGLVTAAHDPALQDGFQGGESWSQQYEGGLNAFPVMGNMMDPAMGGQHGMNPLHAIQQQAMQQQLLQQQAFQQQAIHQHAFQQQALQQQVLQHQAQAMQQEAMRQQAMFMQMSASGVPPGVLPPNPFPANEYSGGLNPSQPSNTRFPDRGTGPWVPGNPPNRSGRGRGRGRTKLIGRGRRNG